ncbi:MAG: hypothetical protein CVU16_06080 [Betaproteobacteria bacterium HGW-Betaproteobacteria-10]|nr:MAG: hypothetical protein CVU16_06080 [Betaproteobacteria bacterium HGW-Betaproteobacteria-10]
MVSLIILVVMTIAGIALIRSVDTSNVIAGNLAFQQAAVHAGDAGVEDAINSVLNSLTAIALQNSDYGKAYSATVTNPADWETHWNTIVNPNPATPPVGAKACADRACSLPTDAAGNTVTYTIERLCQTAGDPLLSPTGCASRSGLAALSGGSLASGSSQLPLPTQYYYRITSRIDGPRNTATYTQTIVAR